MYKQIRSIVRFFFEVAVFFFSTALAFVFFSAVYPLGDGEGVTAVFPYAAAVFVGGIIYMMAYMIGGGEAKGVERGERLRPTWKVRLHSWWKTFFDPMPFYWGGLWYPFEAAVKGLLIVGATGSGKTTLIRLFEQSVLPRISRARDQRAVVYDSADDYLPRLSGMGIDVSEERGLVKNLNPYDQRAWAVNLGGEIQDYRTIDEIAVALIPPQTAGDPFWSNSARSLVKGRMKADVARGKEIDFYEICEDMRSFDRMRQTLEDSVETRHLVQKILDKGKVTESIDVTLYSYMEPYEPIFAIWKRIPPNRRLSLTKWVTDKKGSILVLGRAKEGTAHYAINQLIWRRLEQLITMHLTENSRRRIYLIVDEIRQAKFPVGSIATVGRKFGIVLLIGYQDQAGLEDAYKELIAIEVFGQCQLRVYCALGTEKTALYAANDIGKQEYIDEHGNEKERWVIHPNELTSRAHMPETNRQNGCTFVIKSLIFGVTKMRLRGRKLFGQMLRPLDTRVKGFIPRPASDQFFYDTIAEQKADAPELAAPTQPFQVETTEVQDERAAAEREKAARREKVKQRQQEERARKNGRTTVNSQRGSQRNPPPPDMTIQELLRSLDADES
jgi:energy-coupling factor transporter ATP-binding protein EcfA2